jgi:hypothetical protein
VMSFTLDARRLSLRRLSLQSAYLADYIKLNPDLGEEPVDIEDLVSIGKIHGPYVFILILTLLNLTLCLSF